jgi:hypothetical protein
MIQPLSAPQSIPVKKGIPTWLLVLLIVLGICVVFGGVLATLGIYGMRKYIAQAKQAEGRSAVGDMVKGVVTCKAQTGHLPRTSQPIPSDLTSVSGRKYQSTPTEWTSDAAFACAGFAMTTPQYFQYQWVLEDPENGYAQATADLDGDGSAETKLRLHVRCTEGSACVINPAIQELR